MRRDLRVVLGGIAGGSPIAIRRGGQISAFQSRQRARDLLLSIGHLRPTSP